MNELFAMFRYPRMIKLMAFCAATFTVICVLFKNSIVLIPEVTEIRLVNALALSYGLFFGPAGAVGCALGNLVGDFSGSLTGLSWFGLLGNFFSAYLPYKIWDALGDAESFRKRPDFKASRVVRRLIFGGFLSVISCAGILAFAFDILHTLPALSTFNLIFLNNFSATVLLGLPLFWLLTRFPQAKIPYWKEIMSEEGYQEMTFLGKRLVTIIGLSSLLVAVIMLILDVLQRLSIFTDDFGNRPLLLGLGIYCLLLLLLSLPKIYTSEREKV